MRAVTRALCDASTMAGTGTAPALLAEGPPQGEIGPCICAWALHRGEMDAHGRSAAPPVLAQGGSKAAYKQLNTSRLA